MDEIWNFNFANCIANGLTAYKDFNIIQGPLLPFICGMFLKIFGQEIIIMRFLTIILDTIIFIMIYKIIKILNIKDYFKYLVFIILAFIMKNYFTIDYNWSILLCTLIIIYFEIKNTKGSWKNNLIIGLISGITITLKQTIGIVIVIATIGYKILDVKNIDQLKEYIKNALWKILGVLIVLIIFTSILIKLGAISYYIDYCIKGVGTFSNRISYIDGLIKSSNILITILSVIPLIIYLILGVMYLKYKDSKMLTLLVFSVAQLILVYPISDETHFVVAIVPTLICICYLLNIWAGKINIPIKEELIINSFLESIIFVASIMFFINSIYIYNSKNINMELKHFKYIPKDEIGIEDIKEIDEFIISQEKKVYILDATAAQYMIPINMYNKNYDMFLKGNLGSKGEEGQIENLKNETNKLILIMNSNYNRNWQNPEKVRKYIQTEMTKIGEIGIFDIYE